MLLNNFFYIDYLSHLENNIQADIRIQQDHEIFKGHFPQQPIVPGVCVMEMMKEVLQEALTKKLMLTNSAFTKFLAILSPKETTIAQLVIDYTLLDDQKISVNATLKHASTIYFKFKGQFTVK